MNTITYWVANKYKKKNICTLSLWHFLTKKAVDTCGSLTNKPFWRYILRAYVDVPCHHSHVDISACFYFMLTLTAVLAISYKLFHTNVTSKWHWTLSIYRQKGLFVKLPHVSTAFFVRKCQRLKVHMFFFVFLFHQPITVILLTRTLNTYYRSNDNNRWTIYIPTRCVMVLLGISIYHFRCKWLYVQIAEERTSI
jgi:hypothetical protein